MSALLDLALRHMNHPDQSVRDAAADLKAAEIIRIMNEESMDHIHRAAFHPLKSQEELDDDNRGIEMLGTLLVAWAGMILGGIIIVAGVALGWW